MSTTPVPSPIRRGFRPRRTARLAAVLLAALAAGAAGPGVTPAHAGEYLVYSCQTPDGQAASTEGWSVEGGLPYAVAANDCSGGPISLGLGPHLRHFGDGVGATLRTPPGLRIVALTTLQRLWMPQLPINYLDGGGAPEFVVYRGRHAMDADSVASYCNYFRGCRAYGAREWQQVALPTPTDFVRFDVRCAGQIGGYCHQPEPGTERVLALIERAEILVEDRAAPRVEQVDGTLLESGVRRGVESLSFHATDSGSGVYQVFVNVNGQDRAPVVIDDNGGRCRSAQQGRAQFEFRWMQPCRDSVGHTMEIDTAQLPEGNPRVVVRVRDAAGNLATVIDRRIAIDNVPPPVALARPSLAGTGLDAGLRPGDRLTVTDGAWDGTGLGLTRRWQRGSEGQWSDIESATGGTYTVSRDDIGKQLRAVVRAANSEGAVEQATDATAVVGDGQTVQPSSLQSESSVCVSCNGTGGDALSGQLVVDREQRSVQVKYGAKVVITGRLVDSESRPLAHASLDVFEQIGVTAAQWKKVDTIVTDAQGGYSYRPKSTASRTIRFAYASQRGKSDYRATRDVTIGVQAKITGKAVRKVVKRGGLIRLKGRVTLEALPKAGAWVEVQVHDAGSWRAIATRKLSRTGLWTFKHRLKRSAGLTFKFRARLRPSGEVASTEATSPSVKVRVRQR